MKHRSLILTALALIAAALGLAWWFRTFEWVPREIAAPFKGEARYNAYYALERALRASGHDARSRSAILGTTPALAPGDVVVLGADARVLTPGEVEALVAFVEEGGRLAFALPPAGDEAALLDAFELESVEQHQCLEWKGTRDKTERYCTDRAFLADADAYEWLHGDDGPYAFGRRRFGDGVVVVAASLRFLENRSLKRARSTELAWQLIGPLLGDGRVHLVYATDVPPLYVLIIRNGWPLVVPFALALLAWLASRAGRLGPPLAVAPVHRRALLEHVRAVGELAFRRGRVVGIYTPLRNAVIARIGRTDSVLAVLDGEPLVVALAERHARPVAEIRHALYPTDLSRPGAFVAAIRTLVELKESR